MVAGNCIIFAPVLVVKSGEWIPPCRKEFERYASQ